MLPKMAIESHVTIRLPVYISKGDIRYNNNTNFSLAISPRFVEQYRIVH